MTVEQYRQLPDREDVVQELHWGRVVILSNPRWQHSMLQSRLAELLRPLARRVGRVEVELPFRAVPEYDVRRSDVAFVSQQRCNSTPGDDNLRGSPELVIEVLSPSNTRREIQEKAALCLSTGAQEFWVVDQKRGAVTVMRTGAEPVIYRTGDIIPLPLFGASLAVDEIFA